MRRSLYRGLAGALYRASASLTAAFAWEGPQRLIYEVKTETITAGKAVGLTRPSIQRCMGGSTVGLTPCCVTLTTALVKERREYKIEEIGQSPRYATRADENEKRGSSETGSRRFAA